MKSMRNTLALVLLFAIAFVPLFAQVGQTVKGKVYDEKLSEPLIGVNVMIKGSTKGTVTDIDGNFALQVEKNQTLVFSYIGYNTLEIKWSPTVNLDRVLLSESTQALDEIVIVGYGIQKKNSAVGSISQTKGEDLMKAGSVTTVSQAIQGVLPGVVSMSSTSKPGAEAANILIRGKSSWVDGGSNPLTLIDGVERNFDDVDPNEIETLSVLKDASATAVYGVKGANGVILITTKRGRIGRPTVNVTTNFGFKQPTTKPEYADYVTTMKLWNEGAANDLAWDKLIPESTISEWEKAYANGLPGEYNPYFPEIDWWDRMVANVGYQQQYNVNINGGTEFVKYFASLGYLYDGDIFKTQSNEMYDPSFYYRRYNWRTNFDFAVTKTTTLSLNLSGKQGHRNQNGYRINGEGEDGFGQAQFFSGLYNAARHTFPIQWADGTYGVASNGSGNMDISFNRGQRMYKYYQNFIDAALEQKLDFVTKGLRANLKFAYNAESNTSSRIQQYKGGNFGDQSYIAYYRQWDYSQPLLEGGYALVPGTEKRWANDTFQGDSHEADYDYMLNGGYGKRMYYEFALNYARSFGNHNVTALALVNRNEIEGLKNGSNVNLKFKQNEEAWVTRLTYNWKERYLVEFNGAYTGSQKFAPSKRFDFFPSYSLGWRLSEEPLVKKYVGNYLTNLKLRYSYGTVGYDQSATPYSYIQTYSQGSGNLSLGSDTKHNYGPFYVEGAAANENATWETSVKQNLGFDLTLIDRLNVNVDFFKEDRSGILMDISTPIWVGVGVAKGNIGRTKSHGYELEASWSDKIGKDMRYSIKGNFAFNENRIVFYNDPRNEKEYLKYAGKPIGWQTRLVSTGYYGSLDDIYNYATANNSTQQSKLIPGDLMYLDYNADGVIDETGDKIPVRYNNYPQKSYGFTLGFGWRNFEINAMFYGVMDVYKDVASSFIWDLSDGESGNYYANPNIVDRWTPGTAAMAQKPSLHVLSGNRAYSMRSGTTFVMNDASYLRLKNLELSYRFDSKLIKVLGMSNLQLYVNGNNLFTWTKFNKQQDPEGSGNSVYPLVKRYNVGARISF